MGRDFSKEWAEKCKARSVVREIKKEQREEKLFVNEGIKLYNVVKRTIPLTVDHVLFYGLPLQEAKEMARFLMADRRKRETTKENDIVGYQRSEDIFIFDVLPMEATDKEKSPFYNEGPVITDPDVLKEFTEYKRIKAAINTALGETGARYD